MGEPKIVVVDYHKGNLSSVVRGLARAGAVACTSDDPEQIRRYMAFRETLKMVQNMDWEQEKGPARQGLCHHHASLKKKGKDAHER